LPEEILSNAFIAANGEYARQRPHVFTALRVIAETAQATLGGEVWAVKDGKIWGIIPNTKGETGIWAWDTLPYKANELWSDYCQRAGDESIQARVCSRITWTNLDGLQIRDLKDFCVVCGLL
jgi:hypothetical protein